MWFMIAAAAMSALSSMNGASGERKALKEQTKAKWQAQLKQYQQFSMQNQLEQNRTESALFNIQQGAEQARSQVQLQAAASDTIGASVQDAVSTINVAEDRQTSGAMRDYSNSVEARSEELQGNIDATGQEVKMSLSSLKNKQISDALNLGAKTLASFAGSSASSAGSSAAKSDLQGSSLSSYSSYLGNTGSSQNSYQNQDYGLRYR